MKTTDLFLAGVAAYIPPALPATEAVERGLYDAGACRTDGWTGAAVAGDLSPAQMAATAATEAITRSGLRPRHIALLLHTDTVQGGPHLWSPQHYIERTVIGRNIPAIELRQGCAGLINAVELASCYLLADPARTGALLTAADNWGADPATGPDPAFRWRYARGITSNRGSIFGDAGSAAVLSRHDGIARLRAVASASLSEMEELYRGGEPLFPPGREPTRLGERFARRRTGSARIFKELARARVDLAAQVLAEADLRPDQITRVLHVFAGNDAYIDGLLTPLGIDPRRGMLEYGRGVGHLSVNDQLAALDHLLCTRQVGPGDHLLMMANGIGASLACAALTIQDDPRLTRHSRPISSTMRPSNP